MSSDTESPASAQDEAQRLIEVLRTLVRMLGYTNRDVERRANLNHATATKYFRGEGEPRLEFVLSVVHAIGLEYWEFFELAYGQRTAPSAAGVQLRRMLERLVPSASRLPEEVPVRKLDVEKMLEDLRREVRALLHEQA
jgi:transcriptional regulator with XRE-family HTH domain